MKLFMAVAVVLFSLSNAAKAAGLFELKSASLHRNESSELAELILNFQDKEAVSGACALNLVRFEYLEAVKTLLVQLKPAKFCAREDFGKRQGQVKWSLPASLYTSANLKIILNDQILTDLKIFKGQIIVKTKP